MQRKTAVVVHALGASIVLSVAAASAQTGGTAPSAPGQAETPAKAYLQFYGHLDMSVDVATKGLSDRVQSDGTAPVGNMGWQPAIASNSSFIGVRGGRDLGTRWLRGIFQVEAQADISATPGYSMTNFAQDSRVNGALAARNSFLGLSGPWGSIKLGKHDPPYYLATRRMDPFYGTVGTMTSIMGNTGGDNRVEFAYRMPHMAIYESPDIGGLTFSFLVSPGQNRNEDNLIQPQGEPNCSGYYVPGIVNALCNDGAFGTGVSAAVQYEMAPLYAAAAWELHQRANRTVDETVNGGSSPDGSIGIANEYAWKVAAELSLPTRTKVGAIVERLVRNNPYVNQDYNERDRWGFWVELVQKITAGDDLALGWAHAGRTPGDVGTRRADGSTGQGPVQNYANMYTVGLKHHFLGGEPTLYAVSAHQVNTNGAHYDLGAGSHGIQYNCHDAGPDAPNSTTVPLPFGGGRCFAGATLQAATVGMTYNF